MDVSKWCIQLNNIATSNDSNYEIYITILVGERMLFMSDEKQKNDNERVAVDNDQLGENKDNNGGGKKDGCGCGNSNK